MAWNLESTVNGPLTLQIFRSSFCEIYFIAKVYEISLGIKMPSAIFIKLSLNQANKIGVLFWDSFDGKILGVDTTLSSDSNFEMTPKMEAYFQRQNETINMNDTFTSVTTYLANSWLHPMQKYYTSDYDSFDEVYDVFCIDESGVSY